MRVALGAIMKTITYVIRGATGNQKKETRNGKTNNFFDNFTVSFNRPSLLPVFAENARVRFTTSHIFA